MDMIFRHKQLAKKSLWRDEQGVTTVGMAVSILVALALVFTSGQAYRIDSASAEIQEVADVAALAAENEVAEFMIAVRLCDAVVLSLSLLGLTLYGVGIVALCIPFTAELSVSILEFASKVMDARDTFSSSASSGLNAFEQVLPFLSAAAAASVGSANNATSANANYFATAILVPSSGDEVSIDEAGSSVEELAQTIDDEADEIREKAQEAEDAATEVSEAKQRGFERDCGDNPEYCMYERAATLAGLSAADNPLYQSADTWSFSVALKRAQAYYAARYQNEAPASSSIDEQVNSALRKRFYAWASEQLAQGYVIETSDSFEASFPHLYRNTEEMRSTSLYDEAVYPVTQSDDGLVMHAFEGCPEAIDIVSYGSIRELEEAAANTYVTCPTCKFTAASLGKVPAASTSISNGFEYHYAAVAQAAEDYEAAYNTLNDMTREVKDALSPLLDECADIAKDLSGQRIDITPPGAAGVVALVVNTSVEASDTGFESLFVSSENTLGMRAAVSGATLVEDSGDDGGSVISSLLDGFGQDAGAVVGAARIVLDCWSGLLSVYTDGQAALSGTIESALNALPLVGSSGLGTWASDALDSAFASVGLAPADLDALKAVLVNTSHVTASDTGTFSVTYNNIQQQALAASSSSTGLFSSLADYAQSTSDGFFSSESIQIAEIEFPIGDITIPITITLPSALTDATNGLVEKCIETIRSLTGTVLGVKEWS